MVGVVGALGGVGSVGDVAEIPVAQPVGITKEMPATIMASK
ncbi:MAG TPA: hypothetical protein VIX90_04680 [Edaphobacter sp.]